MKRQSFQDKSCKAQTKWVYFLTVCTKRKAHTHQHGACQILEDSACGFVFQRAIPKCFSAVLLLCFEHIEVPEYFSVLSELFFRFFEADSFRFKLSDMGYNFPLFVFVPEAPIFWTFILIHTISCLSLEDKEQNWQLPPPLSPFPLPLLFIIFFNTSGHSACLCSFSPCHIVPHIFFLHPLFFSFLGHSLVRSSPPSVHSSVLHRQFTKSGIPSLFSLQAFTTIYNTKPQR